MYIGHNKIKFVVLYIQKKKKKGRKTHTPLYRFLLERSPRPVQHQRFGANSLSRDGQSSINHHHNHRPLSHRPRRRPLQPPNFKYLLLSLLKPNTDMIYIFSDSLSSHHTFIVCANMWLWWVFVCFFLYFCWGWSVIVFVFVSLSLRDWKLYLLCVSKVILYAERVGAVKNNVYLFGCNNRIRNMHKHKVVIQENKIL